MTTNKTLAQIWDDNNSLPRRFRQPTVTVTDDVHSWELIGMYQNVAYLIRTGQGPTGNIEIRANHIKIWQEVDDE